VQLTNLLIIKDCSTFSDPLVSSLAQLVNVTVLPYDWFEWGSKYSVNAFTILGLDRLLWKQRFRHFKSKNFDAVLEIEPPIKRRLNLKPLKVNKRILYMLDPLPWNRWKKVPLEDYDTVFVGQKAAALDGRKWLPYGVDTTIFRSYPSSLPKYACTFVGTYYGFRKAIFEQLAGTITAFEGKYGHDCCRIYNNSESALSLSGNLLAARPFEILACKTACIAYDTGSGLETLFQDGRHLSIAHTISELKEKIAYYSNNPEERSQMASDGYQQTLKYHTWANRAQEIVDELR